MRNYVLGFMFSMDGELVALIRKTKPEWQKGLLNGIGGKIEEGETPYQAMKREFQEETGFFQEDWWECGVMNGKDWVCTVFACKGTVGELRTTTDEEVVFRHSKHVTNYPDLIDNLPFLIAMCKHNLEREKITFTVNYPEHE